LRGRGTKEIGRDREIEVYSYLGLGFRGLGFLRFRG